MLGPRRRKVQRDAHRTQATAPLWASPGNRDLQRGDNRLAEEFLRRQPEERKEKPENGAASHRSVGNMPLH
jgi:hypothetical protein